MSNEKQVIPELENIPGLEYKISRGKLWVTLEVQQYEKDNLLNLVNALNKLIALGFKTYDTDHNNGYYGSIKNYYLEFEIDFNKGHLSN